jgi:subtilisin
MALTRPALAALVLLALGTAPAAGAAPPRATAQIVVYKSGVENAPGQTRKRERALGFTTSQRYRHAIEGFAARLTPSQISELRSDPDVAQVVPDRPVSINSVPLVPGGTVPVGLRRVGAVQGSSIRDASGVAVAVIDTGVDLDNTDLNVTAGTNCLGSGPPDDQNGHGTHVAGTIGARNNGSAAVGVAPGTRIYAVQVLDSTGQGNVSSVVCGIDWVTQHAAELGIKVANMSLGGTGPAGTCASDPEHQAICNLVGAGVTVVAAAGNDGQPLTGNGGGHLPGAYPEVLTVSAMADTDGQAGALGPSCGGVDDDEAMGFSNYGASDADAAHMIAAPGGCVVSSAIGGGTLTMSGTSMATPHVTGAAALCINEGGADGPCAGLPPSGVAGVLRQTAQDAATLANGFANDPLHPGSRYYGYLLRATTPPAATTGDANVQGETAADLDGTIDANGKPASWWFELTAGGVTTSTPVQTEDPADDPAPVQAAATDLDPGTAYSYQLVVRADGWTIRGSTKQFSTPGTPPAPPPDTRIDSAPPALSASASAQVAFSAAAGEPAVSFECSLDGGPWAACSSPQGLSALADGQHTLSVRGVGANGKKDATPASATWVVDTTPPDTRIAGAPSDPTTNSDATFGISATETASFECRLDAEVWAPCGAVVPRKNLPAGRHRFEARATDLAGLTDPTPAAYEWTISAAAPAPAPGPRAPAPPVADSPFVSPAPVAPLPRTAILAPLGKVQLDRKRGRAIVTLVCRGPGVCSGRLELRASGRKLGSAAIRLGAGKRTLLVVRIPRRVLKALHARTVTLVVAKGSTTRLQKSRVNLLTTPVNPA